MHREHPVCYQVPGMGLYRVPYTFRVPWDLPLCAYRVCACRDHIVCTVDRMLFSWLLVARQTASSEGEIGFMALFIVATSPSPRYGVPRWIRIRRMDGLVGVRRTLAGCFLSVLVYALGVLEGY